MGIKDRIITLKDVYLNDTQLKKFNKWANDMVDVMFHVVLIGMSFTLIESGFFRYMTIIYLTMFVLAMITPQKGVQKWEV